MSDRQFTHILQTYPDALTDRKRFAGLLKDLMPGQHMQTNLLIMLYDMGLHVEIEKAAQITNTFSFRFVKMLCDEYGVSKENAEWAVSAWCNCFGKELLSKVFENDSPNISRRYYRNRDDGGKLYSRRKDGTDVQKLNDDKSWNITVVGERIFYRNGSDGDKIYTIKIDGSGRQKLNDDRSWDIRVIGERILFRNRSEGDKIYSVNTDGSDRRKLNDDKSWNISVISEHIFYRNGSDAGKLYSIKVDGTNRRKISDDKIQEYDVEADYIYYCNVSDGGKLYSIKVDGTDRKKLSDDEIEDIYIDDGCIYYTNTSDNKAYTIKTDGTERKHNENSATSVSNTISKNNDVVISSNVDEHKPVLGKNINSFGEHAPKTDWLQSFFELKDKFFLENTLGPNQLGRFKRFLRDAALSDKKNLFTPFAELISKLGWDSNTAQALIFVNLAYNNPQINWYISNLESDKLYTRQAIEDLLLAQNIKISDIGSIVRAFKRLTQSSFGMDFNWGCVYNGNLVRTKCAVNDARVILYALFMVVEKNGVYDFELDTLFDSYPTVLSPARIFGLEREEMKKALLDLSTKYPDIISAAFVDSSMRLGLSADKTSQNILELIENDIPSGWIGGGILKGNWIYYICSRDNSSIYAIKTDGTQRRKLNDDKSTSLQIVGDRIYYIIPDDRKDNWLHHGGKLFTIKIDGTDKKKIIDFETDLYEIDDDLIYFHDKDGCLYSVNLNGREKKKIINEYSLCYVRVDGHFYYPSGNDNKLYSVKVDGTGKQKLNDDETWYIEIVDDYIYYSNESDGWSLYRIKKDGAHRQKLNDDNTQAFLIFENRICYCNGSDGDKLYIMDVDGANKNKIGDDNVCDFHLIGSSIYYLNSSDNYKIYSIRSDGSDRKKLCDEKVDFMHIYVVGDCIYFAGYGDTHHSIKTDGTDHRSWQK